MPSENNNAGNQYDAPNQQVVREDGSGPSDEGTGGSAPDTSVSDTGVSSDPLDAMTRDQLVAYANNLGIEVPASATKPEIRDLING